MQNLDIEKFLGAFECRKLSLSEKMLFESKNLIEFGAQEINTLGKLLLESAQSSNLRAEKVRRRRSSSTCLFSWDSIIVPFSTEKHFRKIRGEAALKIQETWRNFFQECHKKGSWVEIIQKKYFLKTVIATIYVIQASSNELIIKGASEFFRAINGTLAEAKLSKEKGADRIVKVIYQLRVDLHEMMAFINLQRVIFDREAPKEKSSRDLLLPNEYTSEEKSSGSPLAGRIN